jgi:hypothetical protein
MSYTANKDGYGIESTAGTSVITEAGSTAYLIGRLASRNIWPSPETQAIYSTPGVNAKEVAANKLFKGNYELRGMLSLMVQNGVPIWWAMGASSTAGSDPYTHTITPITDGSALPTLTWHHEESGSGTAEEYQFQGCMVDSLVLEHDSKGADFLMAKIEMMAMKATDPAFTLTNDPALPATASTGPFENLTRTWDYGSGNTSLDGLQKVSIAIVNGLTPHYAPSWDSGTYTGYWPHLLKDARRKEYRVVVNMHPDTVERALWDELLSRSNSKELYFKWTRSTNDYIEVTCSDCQVVKHEIITEPTDELKVVQVELEPRAMSFSVKDSIAGAAYGE